MARVEKGNTELQDWRDNGVFRSINFSRAFSFFFLGVF